MKLGSIEVIFNRKSQEFGLSVNPQRRIGITLTKDDFKSLIAGGHVLKQHVDIILSDIGHMQMVSMIGDVMRIQETHPLSKENA
jgi:hypothetical protein